MQEQLSITDSKVKEQVIQLLQRLIGIPSFSRQEQGTADLIGQWLQARGVKTQRYKNNVWAYNRHYNEKKPTILLNSHHDTVKPANGYTRDPFTPYVNEGKLYGLGSNDAGGPLVSLIGAFMHFYDQEDMPYNILLAATAEEEISGNDGVECILPTLGKIYCGIVGEPTQMHMAVAERGLMVLDCVAQGKAGHAAREEGDNAIIKALKDIEWVTNFHFDRVSDHLGPVKVSVTVIETDNKAHNVVPATCRFVIDARMNELYTFEEIVQILSDNMHSEVTPRSMRLRSSIIELGHPLVKAGTDLEIPYYGSPTTSDMALMSFPTLKMGPGDSARSHTADEYIHLHEIEQGVDTYVQLLNQLFATTTA